MRYLRTLLVMLLAVAAACGGSSEDSADEGAGAGDETATEEAETATDDEAEVASLGFDSAEEAEIPKLDVETLTAETSGRTLQATPWENTFVGEVTDELFIGIALDDPDPSEAREIRVYLCDGREISTVLTGELNDGRATLSGGSVVVDIVVSGDEITGSVQLDDGADQPFTATASNGDAGVFVLAGFEDDEEVWGAWIVLPDGRQQGSICVGVRTGGGTYIGVYIGRN